MSFDNKEFDDLIKHIQTYEDGQIIFEEGTPSAFVFIIAYGEIEIFRIVNGKKIILDRVGEGESLGVFFTRRFKLLKTYRAHGLETGLAGGESDHCFDVDTKIERKTLFPALFGKTLKDLERVPPFRGDLGEGEV